MTTTAYALGGQVSFQRVGDDAVLLHSGSGDYYGLNDSGALVIEELLAHGNLDRAIQAVCHEYGTAPDDVQADVQRLVAALVAYGLLERKSE